MLQALLAPVSWAYAGAGALKHALARPQIVSRPVVCIGNLTLGGAGKTPVTRALRAVFAELGVSAHTVSRGYGGRLLGPCAVDRAIHTCVDVGDEPLLHARDGEAWIARDRHAGAQAAIDAGARLVLLDDGLQNPALHKDFSFIVIDAGTGFGNRRVFPAGPLREPLAAGLKRADAFIIMGDGACDALDAIEKPVLRAYLAPLAAPPEGPLLAFAGIARPQKFFDTLIAAGADLRDGVAFPDHHVFTASELAQLRAHGESLGARLITTEKDHVRLPASWRDLVDVLAVSAHFRDGATLRALLAPVAARAREEG
jgi:tetraacyldisaccharide 4'-kinase